MPTIDLITLLRTPQRVEAMREGDWNLVVVQARQNQLLGQLAGHLERAGVLDKVPAAVRRHLDLELLTAKRRAESALWEVASIRRSIPERFNLALLKGCAYAAIGDTSSVGRLFSDMDLLVTRANLPELEIQLLAMGYKPKRVNDYDMAYYRNWMHEVPPMEHVRRHTVVDLHHAINPPISRFYVDPAKLFERLEAYQPGLYVLCATDRIIHCALHLLQEGEPKKLLRDLFDLYLLLDQHAATPAQQAELSSRVSDLGVTRPVDTAVQAAMTLFNASVAATPVMPGWLQLALTAAARHGVDGSGFVGVCAGWMVLAHSHWMKMPWRILLPHLFAKVLAGLKSQKED